jgi:hypothetical protein
VSTFLGGIRICSAYIEFLNRFAHVAGLYGQSSLRLWQFDDLNSFSHAVAGGRTAVGLVILGSISAASALCLGTLLWKSGKGSPPARYLAWAITLTWSTLLNLYFPIYDTILIVISIVISIAAARELNRLRCTRRVTGLALLVFGTAWITESIAKAYGIQLLTLSILALGITQMFLLRRAIEEGRSQVVPKLVTA